MVSHAVQGFQSVLRQQYPKKQPSFFMVLSADYHASTAQLLNLLTFFCCHLQNLKVEFQKYELRILIVMHTKKGENDEATSHFQDSGNGNPRLERKSHRACFC
jgi:hypothetical protein